MVYPIFGGKKIIVQGWDVKKLGKKMCAWSLL